MNKITAFKPLLQRCLVKKLPVKTSSVGGIILPKTNDRDNRIGEVVAVGPGYHNDEGHFIKNTVNVGDFVLLPEYSLTKIPLDDNDAEYYVLRDSEILATLEKKI